MFQAGVARTTLTPFRGVELTGWGYYIERRWRRVHDHLNATALALDDGRGRAVLVALDLMVIDEPFTRRTRERIRAAIGLPPESILLTCSHSHNAPAAGDGTSPLSTTRDFRRRGFGSGIADSSATVYGWRGSRYSWSTVPISAILPRYITPTRSEKYWTTDRLWLMNR